MQIFLVIAKKSIREGYNIGDWNPRRDMVKKWVWPSVQVSVSSRRSTLGACFLTGTASSYSSSSTTVALSRETIPCRLSDTRTLIFGSPPDLLAGMGPTVHLAMCLSIPAGRGASSVYDAVSVKLSFLRGVHYRKQLLRDVLTLNFRARFFIVKFSSNPL